MTPDPGQLIAVRVADHLGFVLSVGQRQRLARAIDELGGPAGAIGGGPARVAARALLGTPAFEHLMRSVLIGETFWFRDRAQLDAVVEVLAARAPHDRRVWSAGCSTGQEPYSLAIALHRAGVWPVQIIASDIDADAVRATRAGSYLLRRQRGLDPETVADYGSTDGQVWTVRPDIKAAVTAVHHHLLTDPPHPSQIILCRNVLLYFTPAAAQEALARFAAALPADGTLVLGHAETQMPGPPWTPVRRNDIFTFTPAGPRTAPPASEVRPTADRPASPVHRPDPPVVDVTHSGTLLRQGEVALEEGRVGDAITSLRQARYLNSSDPVAATLLGVALARGGYAADAHRTWSVARHLLEGLPREVRLVGGYPPAVIRHWIDDLEAEALVTSGRHSPPPSAAPPPPEEHRE